MTTQVTMPQGQKKNELGMLGTIVGGGVGAVYGGPAGAATGMGIGGTVGGMADQQSGPQGGMPMAVQQPGDSKSSQIVSNAVARRQQQLQDAQALTDAQVAVQKDPRLQQQFGPTLAQAQQQNALQRYQSGGVA